MSVPPRPGKFLQASLQRSNQRHTSSSLCIMNYDLYEPQQQKQVAEARVRNTKPATAPHSPERQVCMRKRGREGEKMGLNTVTQHGVRWRVEGNMRINMHLQSTARLRSTGHTCGDSKFHVFIKIRGCSLKISIYQSYCLKLMMFVISPTEYTL